MAVASGCLVDAVVTAMTIDHKDGCTQQSSAYPHASGAIIDPYFCLTKRRVV